MKKHIIGFTIFAFIVGSFVSIWALFGYFTQTIPNVPTIESENLPIFASDKKTSCFPKQREKLSYEVANSYYFDDEKTVVSTLRLKWNGFGIPPKNLVITPKFYIGGKEVTALGKSQSRQVNLTDLPNGSKRELNMSVNVDQPFSKNELKENIYVDFNISSESGEQFGLNKSSNPTQVVLVHGESSINKSDRTEITKQ